MPWPASKGSPWRKRGRRSRAFRRRSTVSSGTPRTGWTTRCSAPRARRRPTPTTPRRAGRRRRPRGTRRSGRPRSRGSARASRPSWPSPTLPPAEAARRVERTHGSSNQGDNVADIVWQTLVHNSYHVGQIVLPASGPRGLAAARGPRHLVAAEGGRGGLGPGGKLRVMTDALAAEGMVPCEPDIDENGVDLAQIREMLDRAPAERLSMMAEFMSSLLAIRARNEDRRSG